MFCFVGERVWSPRRSATPASALRTTAVVVDDAFVAILLVKSPAETMPQAQSLGGV
jgi:hypothetical protein